MILNRCDCFKGDKCIKLIEMIEMKLRLFCDALLYKETCIHILYKIILGSIETHLREEVLGHNQTSFCTKPRKIWFR